MQRATRSKKKQTKQSSVSKSKSPTKEKKQSKKRESSSESGEEEKKISPTSRRGVSQTTVAFSKGSYVAFVDPADNLETYKIGFLTEDFRDVDEELLVDVFEEMAPLTFKQEATKQSVMEYCLITEVSSVTMDKDSKRKQPIIKITKSMENKILKLMNGVVSKLDKQQAEESDDESESEEESDSSSSSGDEESEDVQKDTLEQIKSRRMVKVTKNTDRASKSPLIAKRSTSARGRSKDVQSQPVLMKAKTGKGKNKVEEEKKNSPPGSKKKGVAEESKRESPKRGGRNVSQRTPSKQSKKQADAIMEEEEESKGNDSESIMQINTSKKKGKGISKTPKVGEKRKRAPSNRKAKKEQSESNQGSDEDNSQVTNKKRRGTGGKAEKVKKEKGEKKKKEPKRPTEFKKGKWNPDIQLLEQDKYKEDKSPMPFFDCCIRCNNKNMFRPCNGGGERLLKECLAAVKKISILTPIWSPEFKWTPMEIYAHCNLHEMLELILHPKINKIPQYSTYEQERNNHYAQRIGQPQYLLNFVDSGMVSQMAYGARVRKVQMTRGNRQGNNAFLQYLDNPITNPWQYVADQTFLRRLFYDGHMTAETLQILIKLNPNVETTLSQMVVDAVRAGNQPIAFDIVSRLVKFPNYGFNNLHCEVLNENSNVLEKFAKVSVTKKANTNKDITPLHCACINPNDNILKQLLDVSPEFNVPDSELRRPVHYAAACKSSGPLRLLIAAGASLHDVDNKKMTCLHIAAKQGRHENVRLILENNKGLLNMRNKRGYTAMVYACKFYKIEVVKVLLEFKAKLNAGQGLERMPPLSWAAALGSYELVEYLLQQKARVLSKDKFGRTPLIMACRNGHARIAALLLQYGSDWNHTDTSMNTPLHYAAAYGWLDIIDLLFAAGADVNAQNSWRITPINIAMLKNHTGAVKRILDQPNVDVNCKDEKGRTLLLLSLVSLDEDSHEFIKYLLQKGANPNIADLEGQTSLHYIAKYNPRTLVQVGHADYKQQYEQQLQIQKQVAQLLIDNHADLSLKDKNEQTPFAICLANDNAPILKFLQHKVSLNKEPELFFAFACKLLNMEYQKIFFQLMENERPTKESINYLDKNGYTPFLKYIEAFTENYSNLHNLIMLRVNALSFKQNGGVVIDQQAIINQITNADLFDKFPDTTNFYTYNYQLAGDTKILISDVIATKIIVEPFIKMLAQLIKMGANSSAQVQQLKKYRDLDEESKQMFAQLQGNQLKQKEEEKVKKREDILRERRQKHVKGRTKYNGRTFAASAKSQVAPGGQAYAQINSVGQDYNTANIVYDTREGVKIERKYPPQGLRNAIHFITSFPHQTVLDFLISLKINPDQPDYDETTPFNLMSRSSVYKSLDKNQEKTRQKLIKLNIRIDFPDINGRTPFLNFYEQQNQESQGLAYQMLDLGANVNQIDASGLFALKYALIRRQNNEMDKLISRGGNVNTIDNKGRNLLHHAVNMSSATADATFETEQFLIEKGIELNLKDQHNRTPLHYAFVKIKDWKSKNQIDPIETVSSLCGCKGLEMDVADKWKKTPLHYASQRGASVSSVYLINRGANYEQKDIYGNTPLGVALLSGHYNYGIILIEKNTNVSCPIFREYPEKLAKQWALEAELYKMKKKGANDMEIDTVMKEKGIKEKKRHKNLFDPNVNVHMGYYGNEDDSDYDDEEDEEEQDAGARHQEWVFNQQNAFGMTVYQNQNPNINGFGAMSAFGGGMINFNQGAAPRQTMPAQINNNNQDLNLVKEEGEEQGASMFKVAIRAGQQGLAYLILDKGYDLMLAMQDAMDEKKFMLVLTLLSKNPNDEIVQQCNSKGQNLFHILSMNAGGCSFEHLKRIYETLLKRGVNCKAKDNYQRTALHYAVKSHSLQLVKMLLDECGEGVYNPNEIDCEGQSPLSICLKGDFCNSCFFNSNNILPMDNIFLCLVKHGADVNIVYPELKYKPAFKEEDVEDEQYNSNKGFYKCSPLINVIRANSKFKTVMRENILGLVQYGAKFNIVDSDGRDPMMYAIMNDNEELVKLLIENKRQLLMIDNKDKVGKTAVHYVVNPIKYGSYENVKILKSLHQVGYSLIIKDNSNKAPLAYAQEQESGVLLQQLISLQGISKQQLQNFQRMQSSVHSKNWPDCKVDFDLDSETLMEVAKAKEEEEFKDKKNKVPVDSTGKFEVSYEVYYDENSRPWDVYLTKVDLKNGIYGDYVFYKMQMLYDTNRDLYVVFTRWGRIGETGMNQRTPFVNVDEAKNEYRKIFKQKTGGNTFDEIETFDRVKKKYNLTKVNYVTVNYKDFLAPFDYDKLPKTRLPKAIFNLFEEIANVTMYQRAMTQFGVDTTVLPVSSIKREALIQARQILTEIKDAVDEDIKISKEGIRANFEELTAVKEKISELSSRFYELIPLANYKNQIAPPISNHHQIKNLYDNLEGLSNIEYASKILLGALYKQNEQNPTDYVYDALNLMIEALDKESPEFEVVNQYIANTRNVDQYNASPYEIANIFKIQRKGEAEVFSAYKELPNHFLLYHGSMLFNFIGILSQGLRIAPPEAPPTGYMFGKGLYFADMFDKSANYSQRGYNQQDSYLMLMCEVALGKSKELTMSEYVEKLEPQYQSVKGCGRRGPDYDHTIVLPNGVKIPYGPVVDYYATADPVQQRLIGLQHNEYIVYNAGQVRMRYLIQIKKKENKK